MLLVRDVAVVVAPAVDVGAVEGLVARERVQGVEEAVARVVLVELAVLLAHAREELDLLVGMSLAELGQGRLGDVLDGDDDLVDGGGVGEEVILVAVLVFGEVLKR